MRPVPVDRALETFLATNLASAKARLASGELTGVDAEEALGFVDTMTASASLRPDAPITRTGRMAIGAADFEVHVTDHAVTDADIWLYDRRSRVAVLGDLVTLPAPFFETACSERWRETLNEVWEVPFRIAVPGHGEPMTRAQFDIYRHAFGAFVDCVRGSAEASGLCRALA